MLSRSSTAVFLLAMITDGWQPSGAQPPPPLPDVMAQVRELLLQEMYREAMARAQKAMAAEPSKATSHIALGEALRIAAQDFETALKEFRLAAQMDPKLPDGPYCIAICLEAQDKRREAVEQWKQFLKLEPDTDRAWLVRHGLVLVRLARLSQDGVAPEWAPDGKHIAVTSANSVSLVSPRDPNDRTLLATGQYQYVRPSWSPDGRYLVLERRGPGRTTVLSLLDVLRQEPERVLVNADAAPGIPAWSPDGECIAFAHGHSLRVEFTNLKGGITCRIFAANRIRKVATFSSWSRDGERIVFSASQTYSAYDLFIAQVKEGQVAVPLHEAPGNDICPTFHPSGGVVLFASNAPHDEDGAGMYALYAVSLGEKPETRRVTPLVGAWARFSPDGRWLAVSQRAIAGAPGGSNLMRLGGLPPSQVYLDGTVGEKGVTAKLESLSDAPLKVTGQYEVLDERGIRVARGRTERDAFLLKPGEVVEWLVTDAAVKGTKGGTVKLIAVTNQGLRAAALVDLNPRPQ